MKKLYALVAIATLGISANAQIVINEVYGGGGNSGATYTNDFVELVNRGSAVANLSGGYLQYTSTGGAFTVGNILALPSITLQPGQYYLIQLAKGSGGTTALPAPDFAPSGTAAPDQPLALSGTGGKIALTTNNILVSTATDANVLDFVGWGTATQYETAAAPATTNTTSITRTNGVDTNNNKADFITAAPSPQNMASPVMQLATVEVNGQKTDFIKNTIVDSSIMFGAKSDVKIYSIDGKLVKSATANAGSALDVSSLAKGVYIVAGEVNGQKVSQKIIKK